ncbi:MAG: TolC family protein [Pseudomonadota bacterium]|nr:TolC family protein [Pseudomonadota bacterium]
MKLRWLWVLAFAGACGVVPCGRAAEPLLLKQAVARSLASNQSLAADAADLRAVETRAEREALPTSYFVGGDLENVAGTGSLSGVQSAETTLRLGRVIELGGKRAARQALGGAEIARQQSAAFIARLDLASRTTGRFIEVLADQQRLDYARERVKQAERTRREVSTWVAAARNPESDLHAAQIAVAEAELEREHAEHELASARMTLAASWGSFEPDFPSVRGDLSELPAIESFEALTLRLPETPGQRRALLESEVLAAKRRVAEASAKPDLTVSLGVRRLEAFADQGLVMSVSLPLGSKTRASLAIAEADAQLAALNSRRLAQHVESHQNLFEKYQELIHARTEYQALRTRMLPKAEQALAFTRRGFEAGRFSFAALAQAQRTLFDLHERSIEAAARYHTRLVEVERLTAVSMETTP